MENSVKFICYGESVENLKISIEFNVIGIPNRSHFEENEDVYLAVKVKGLWVVCGKASILYETEINPFEKYYTYSIGRLITCKPFAINAMSKQILGSYWGLIFQRPKRVTNKEFSEYIQNNFVETSPDEMLEQLSMF